MLAISKKSLVRVLYASRKNSFIRNMFRLPTLSFSVSDICMFKNLKTRN